MCKIWFQLKVSLFLGVSDLLYVAKFCVNLDTFSPKFESLISVSTYLLTFLRLYFYHSLGTLVKSSSFHRFFLVLYIWF